MKTIQEHIQDLADTGISYSAVATKLKVSPAMVSAYRHKGFLPSIDVAKVVYATDGVVLHPFSKESLQHEVQRDTIKPTHN